MELELNKRKINFYDNVYESGVIHEENGELIVPDASPDMERIIFSGGRVYIKEKNIHDGSVTLSGMVEGCVLYIADGETGIRKLDIHMPISHSFESPSISSDLQCVACSELTSLEAREINSRKIAIRAHIAIDVKCYAAQNMEITQGIENREEFSVEVRNDKENFYVPALIKERSFTIIDDIEIPKGSPNFHTMLNNDVTLTCTDMKLIGNKAIIKGVAGIKYTYCDKDGIVNVASHNLPYSQIMDIEDFEEECDLNVKMNIRALNIEPAHDMTGDIRYISVNILVDTTLMAYLKENVSLIEDLYSTAYVLNAQFEELPAHKMSEHINKRVAVNENIETANLVQKVLDTKIVLEPMHQNGDKIQNDAQIQILYLGDDGEIYCVQRRCSAECMVSIPTGAKILCDTSVTGETATGSGNQIAVHFFVDYDVKLLSKDKIRNLRCLSSGEERTGNTDEAYVIVKHIYSDQPIWNIAKKYNTTVDEIAAANGLDFYETVEAGSMLLIPCGK